MKKTQSILSAPERILETAKELFYKQGYRSTGINEIIAKSGVAKATFYSHFPAKDDLGQAYLKAMLETEVEYLRQFVGEKNTPLERFMAVIESLIPWLEATNYRGCAFINIAGEICEADSPMLREGRTLYDTIRARVRTLSEELVCSDKRFAHLDPNILSEEYMLNFVGGVALAGLYQKVWPVEQAIAAVRRRIGL